MQSAFKHLALGSAVFLTALGAQAQSSVSVYGLLDLSMGSTKAPGGSSVKTVDSGKMTTSYFGFGGKEDLGGGLSAVFKLESFMRAHTGAQGRFDGDTAFVSETYTYHITFKDSARAPIERRGAATSVLRKRGDEWRFDVYHSSARPFRPAA